MAIEQEALGIRKKRPKDRRPARVQLGALPYRFDLGTGVEVLLVTSRGTRRWIIPKGWPIKGFKPARTAAREAYEEAGVRGRVAGHPLGRYIYEKRLEERAAPFPCEVQVFPLFVKKQLKKWPERKQRTVRWFRVPEAAALITDDNLRRLISQLDDHKAWGAEIVKALTGRFSSPSVARPGGTSYPSAGVFLAYPQVNRAGSTRAHDVTYSRSR